MPIPNKTNKQLESARVEIAPFLNTSTFKKKIKCGFEILISFRIRLMLNTDRHYSRTVVDIDMLDMAAVCQTPNH